MNYYVDEERISELTIDEWIWVVFIILSFLNIIGDEKEKYYCIYHNIHDKTLAKKIFTFTVFCSFIIYLYLANKNCKKYRFSKTSQKNTSLIGTRCFASILVVIASFLFLIAQFRDSTIENPSIE